MIEVADSRVEPASRIQFSYIDNNILRKVDGVFKGIVTTVGKETYVVMEIFGAVNDRLYLERNIIQGSVACIK